MCYLNAFGSLTLTMLYIWSDPFADSDDEIKCTQWCILPIVILFIPITLVLDIIFLPVYLSLFICNIIGDRRQSNTENIQSNEIDSPV